MKKLTHAPTYNWLTLSGPQKTALLRSMAERGGEQEPLIRQTAVRLVRGLPRDAHAERIARIHRFVRDNVEYHREPVEMFHYPTHTLLEGGDCDDHVMLVCAMAWSLKYPWRIIPVGNPEGPRHYTCQVGYPQSETPRGDSSTRWVNTETTIDAKTGESVEAAERRLWG